MKKTILFLSIFVCITGIYACLTAQGNKALAPYQTNSLEAELEQLFRLDLLPKYRYGIVEQVSSYDTTGMNDDGFSGKYSFIRKEDNKLVLADLKGPGVINRIWTPTPTQDTIQFYFDGESTPRINIPFIDLFSGKIFPFVNPVCGNEVGGYYCYIPIQYSKSCKIMYTGRMIQFHQIQSRPYPEGTPVESFRMNWPDKARSVLEKACTFWNGKGLTIFDILKNEGLEVKSVNKKFFLSPGENISFFKSNKGGRIVGIELECGSALEGDFKDILIQAQWDNDSSPAIDCPAADFFGYAYGKPAMRSIVAGNSASGVNYFYLPMPYEKKGELRMAYKKRTGTSQPKVEITAKVYCIDIPRNPAVEGRLYATWRREIEPAEGEPYLFDNIKDKGHYVGTIHLAQGLNPGMTVFFEGDDVTLVDGKMRMHGTGSEDFYNGGWYALLDRWDRGVSLPIHGSLDYSLQMGRTGAYRFNLTDKLTFEEELKLTIEHGPEYNRIPVDYTSVAFFYGNKPSGMQVQITEQLRTVFYPTSHVFYPQLMDFALGGNTEIINRRGRLMVSTEGEGMVRLLLSDIPEGNYKISLTYFSIPEGASFSIWNRQKMIMDWKDTFSEKERRMERQEIGSFQITRQTNSISIRIRKNDNRNKFHFENLYLERLKD